MLKSAHKHDMYSTEHNFIYEKSYSGLIFYLYQYLHSPFNWLMTTHQFLKERMVGSMVGSLIDSASQKRVHSKSQKRDRSKPQFWEYYRFRNDTNIGYISISQNY